MAELRPGHAVCRGWPAPIPERPAPTTTTSTCSMLIVSMMLERLAGRPTKAVAYPIFRSIPPPPARAAAPPPAARRLAAAGLRRARGPHRRRQPRFDADAEPRCAGGRAARGLPRAHRAGQRRARADRDLPRQAPAPRVA